MERIEFYKKVGEIQQQLKVGKGRYNDFGGFAYRSVEDIYKDVKPLLAEKGLILKLRDEIVVISDRVYVQATATITDGKNYIDNTAYARESASKKGFDDSQLTGSASSYARKYALSGLFLLDCGDTDPDSCKPDVDYITEEQKALLLELGADLNKIASYFKKKNIDFVTHEEAEQAIQMKGGNK